MHKALGLISNAAQNGYSGPYWSPRRIHWSSTLASVKSKASLGYLALYLKNKATHKVSAIQLCLQPAFPMVSRGSAFISPWKQAEAHEIGLMADSVPAWGQTLSTVSGAMLFILSQLGKRISAPAHHGEAPPASHWLSSVALIPISTSSGSAPLIFSTFQTKLLQIFNAPPQMVNVSFPGRGWSARIASWSHDGMFLAEESHCR